MYLLEVVTTLQQNRLLHRVHPTWCISSTIRLLTCTRRRISKKLSTPTLKCWPPGQQGIWQLYSVAIAIVNSIFLRINFMRPDAPVNKESAVYQMVLEEEMRKTKGICQPWLNQYSLTVAFTRFIRFAWYKKRSCSLYWTSTSSTKQCDQARICSKWKTNCLCCR